MVVVIVAVITAAAAIVVVVAAVSVAVVVSAVIDVVIVVVFSILTYSGHYGRKPACLGKTWLGTRYSSYFTLRGTWYV